MSDEGSTHTADSLLDRNVRVKRTHIQGTEEGLLGYSDRGQLGDEFMGVRKMAWEAASERAEKVLYEFAEVVGGGTNIRDNRAPRRGS